MKYLIANWKANKNLNDANTWIDLIINNIKSINAELSIIICPPNPLIYSIKSKINGLKNIYLASQDISIYESGSFTGEVTVKTLANLVNFTIIGHSERRQYFNETDEILFKKSQLALKYQVQPIYCIRNEKDNIPNNIKYIAYEPIYAIGTDNNEPIDKIITMKNKLHLPVDNVFIYGGSVNLNNYKAYLNSPVINGLLIGNASLDPEIFLKMANNQ